MPEPVTSGPAQSGGRFHWGRAITAGLIATIVMTVVMALMKMNLVKMLGGMIVGPTAGTAMQYAVGGAMHFMIGIGYGIIYAALVGRVVEWNRFVKGAVYGLAIAAIALAAMPVMSAMMGRGAAGAQNPCGGSSGKAAAMNPCHPQSGAVASTAAQPSDAMNPCHGKESSAAMNPCHPQSGTAASTAGQPSGAMNPCHGKEDAANPCHPAGGGAGNPCNPCGGGGGGPWSGVLSVINHLVYALTLAFVYGKVR